MFELGVTVGDGCITVDDLEFCATHGVTKFRVNLANNWGRANAEAIAKNFKNIKQRNPAYAQLSILWDMPFPNKKPRYRTFQGKAHEVIRGELVELIRSPQPVSHPKQIAIPDSLFRSIEVDDHLVVGDGETALITVALTPDVISCTVSDDWFLSDGKSLTIESRENVLASSPSDLPLTVVENSGLPYDVACSFIRGREDLEICRQSLPRQASIMSKIETAKGVENINEIALLTDSVMIARGDLALNVGFNSLGRAQDTIIQKCISAHVPVFVATEVLSSLSFRAVPLRAEVSDLYNVSRMIRDGGIFLTKESSMPEMLRRSLPLIAEITADARADLPAPKKLEKYNAVAATS